MAEYKILVPLDGSRTAEHALVYLRAFKRLGACTVRLLAVADETEEFHHANAEEAINREANLLSTYLREVAKDVEAHAGVTVEMKVVRGLPAVGVAEEVESFAPDLMVICTHGRTGVSRWRLGSVVDKVIRSVSCNILVVGPSSYKEEPWIDAGIERPFESILVPLDGSQLANEAIPVAVRFAKSFDSRLHLARVVKFLYGGSFYEGAYMPDYSEALMDGAAQHLQQAASGIEPAVPCETAVLMGEPASQLETYAAERNIDLIVMTSHGRGGFARTALGSVTDRLLSEAPAPVLVVRAAGS
jgi:nucleotide-binding universal stress UspA family protein